MKRKLWLLLVLAFLLALACAAHAESGTCGTNLTWNLSGTTLRISGTGAMTDYGAAGTTTQSPFPRDKTYSVVLESGVTGVGTYAFHNCRVDGVNFGGVTTIGQNAFKGTRIYSMSMPDTVRSRWA